MTPLEDVSTALKVEGINGSDNTEIASQNTSVSVGDEESYEIELIFREPVEAISLIDESTEDKNAKSEQTLPNTDTTDQSTSVLLGSVMALLNEKLDFGSLVDVKQKKKKKKHNHTKKRHS